MAKIDVLVPRFVDYMPAVMQEGIIYISKQFQTAIHLCCCGCRIQTVTPFDSPNGWTLTVENDTVSLAPSIGNQKLPCKSHYTITQNKVQWHYGQL